MAQSCINCGQVIEAGDYILVGVEQGSWSSQYAHRGSCEDEARRKYRETKKSNSSKKSRKLADEPLIEELSLDEAPDPFPDDDLPWFGQERRR